MKHASIVFFALLGFLALDVQAQDTKCTPEATQQLGGLMQKVSTASQKMNSYKTKFKTDSQAQSDQMAFCLSSQSRPEFKQLFEDVNPVIDEVEGFEGRQSGDCKASAEKARLDLENNVRNVMARLKRCQQNFK